MDDLRSLVETFKANADQTAKAKMAIRQNALRKSTHLDGGNFKKIHSGDLWRLFEEYDQYFFDSSLARILGDTPLRFSLSKRMTRAAGTTIQSRCSGGLHYEIRISAVLLFQCFNGDDHRLVLVAGIVCNDRLEALQVVLEHELIHLIEWLLWSKSSCSKTRFQSIASRFFAHRSHRHQLITPAEQARVKFGIQPGDYVGFRFDNEPYTGTVIRITKRATVLVESRRGTRYSDGKKYVKIYVPVQRLKVLSSVTDEDAV